MELRIVAVGERMPDWVAEGVQTYAGRMPPTLPVRLVVVPASGRRRGGDTARAMAEEGGRLLEASSGCVRVALDEQGREVDTAGIARWLDDWMMDGRDVAFLIGGADGLDRDTRAAADRTWSLSALTFPHMLVRVILAEQLYRAWTVLNHHPYHRA